MAWTALDGDSLDWLSHCTALTHLVFDIPDTRILRGRFNEFLDRLLASHVYRRLSSFRIVGSGCSPQQLDRIRTHPNSQRLHTLDLPTT